MYLDFGHCIGLIIWISCIHLVDTQIDFLRSDILGGYLLRRRMVSSERMTLMVQQMKQGTHVDLSHKSGIYFELLLERNFQGKRHKRDTSDPGNVTRNSESQNSRVINSTNGYNDTGDSEKRDNNTSNDSTNDTQSIENSEHRDNNNCTNSSNESINSDKSSISNNSSSNVNSSNYSRKGKTAFAFGNPSLPKKPKRRKPPKPRPLG